MKAYRLQYLKTRSPVRDSTFVVGHSSDVSRCLLLLLPLVALLHCETSSAQYQIDWFTIDGGGGTSTGGVYAVKGSIGQPGAGTMTNGTYAVSGGFWSVVAAIQTPGAPLLTVSRHPISGVVTISWPLPATGFVLDQTTALIGSPVPWSQVAFPHETNATHISSTVPAPAGNRFYRLRRP